MRPGEILRAPQQDPRTPRLRPRNVGDTAGSEVPRVSVVVLTWDGRDLLADCLASLQQQTFTDFEVLVVDNGSRDGSAGMVREQFPGARLLEQPENRGFCRGNNLAMAEARGDLLVLLNNDAEVAPDFLEQFVAAADENPHAAMFAAKILMFDRRDILDSAGLLVYPDGVCRSRGWLEPDDERFASAADVLGPNGCAAMYRREMLEDTGLFDERYFAYLEDLDLAMRGQLRGWTCRYVPDAVVYHKKSMTSGYHSAFKAYHVERNRLFNSIKLFPLRLLLLSPLYTLVRYLSQGFASLTGRGISSSFRRDYSHVAMLGILLRAHVATLRELPGLVAERRRIQGTRRLTMMEVFRLMRTHRLPLADLAFKD